MSCSQNTEMKIPMKTLFCALTLILCLVRLDAAAFKLNGDLTWKIIEPRCTFNLAGDLQNLSPAGTTSGTIKLVLWVTGTPYPAPGYIIGEYTLGQIGGNQQFSDFSVRTTSNIPTLTGNFHFTIAVVEYTPAGWMNRLLVPTGTQSLVKGNFPAQPIWTIPNTVVTAPNLTFPVGQRLILTQKATSLLNLFPVKSQTMRTVTVDSISKVTVKNTDGQSTARFTYKVKKDTLRGAKVSAGSLYVRYDSSTSFATITLYFQGANSGTYRSVETIASKAETTWGTFTSQ